jgi:hypothetical protein
VREVLRTRLLSDAEAARLALEAKGIRAELLDRHSIGYAGLAGEIRVAVADRDAARAQEILEAMRPRPVTAATPESWRWQRPGCVLLGVSLLILLPLSFVVLDSAAPVFVKTLAMSAAIIPCALSRRRLRGQCSFGDGDRAVVAWGLGETIKGGEVAPGLALAAIAIARRRLRNPREQPGLPVVRRW